MEFQAPMFFYAPKAPDSPWSAAGPRSELLNNTLDANNRSAAAGQQQHLVTQAAAYLMQQQSSRFLENLKQFELKAASGSFIGILPDNHNQAQDDHEQEQALNLSLHNDSDTDTKHNNTPDHQHHHHHNQDSANKQSSFNTIIRHIDPQQLNKQPQLSKINNSTHHNTFNSSSLPSSSASSSSSTSSSSSSTSPPSSSASSASSSSSSGCSSAADGCSPERASSLSSPAAAASPNTRHAQQQMGHQAHRPLFLHHYHHHHHHHHELGPVHKTDSDDLDRIRNFIEQFKARRGALGLTQKQAAQCFRAYTNDRYAFSDNFVGHFEGFQFRPQTAMTIADSLAEWLEFAENETRNARQLNFMPGKVKETRKRKYEVIRIRDSAKRVLVEAFEKNKSPSTSELEQLSRKTNIPSRNIEIFFKNRRTSRQYHQ